MEIKATVMKETADSITSMMEQTGMTMGEAIDRLALHMAPSDPDMAADIALEETLYIFSQLDKQGFLEAISRVVLSLGACLPNEVVKSLSEDIGAYKKSIGEKFTDMSEEKMAQQIDAFKEFIDGIYENDK